MRSTGVSLGDPKYLAPFFRIPGLARSDVVESELAARGLSVFSSDTFTFESAHWDSATKGPALCE